MPARIWDRYLTPRDRAVFAASGYGTRGGFGRRPALLVVDVSWDFCGDRPEPILDSIERWPNSCGEAAWVALDRIVPLIGAARARGLPVIYSTGFGRPDRWDEGSWAWKNGRTADPADRGPTSRDGNEIVDVIAPRPEDIVVRKQKPSAFFGTNLASYLTLLRADTVVVAGTTTSGCVRATVLDAFSLNYRVIVAEDGCFDRAEANHAINLCDMNAKYADVIGTAEIIDHFSTFETGLFELPKGSKGGADATPEHAARRSG